MEDRRKERSERVVSVRHVRLALRECEDDATDGKDAAVDPTARFGARQVKIVGGREVDAKLLGLRNEKKVSFDMSSVTDEDDMNAALETLSTSEPGWDGAY